MSHIILSDKANLYKLTRVVGISYLNAELTGQFGSQQPIEYPLKSKPPGSAIWLSINGEWEQWCADNMPGLVCPTSHTILTAKLKHGLKLWHINSLDDFNTIWFDYLHSSHNEVPLDMPSLLQDDIRSPLALIYRQPDIWTWLMKKGFAGVMLTEQGESETRFVTWLYGWDCASIVIFDRKNVILQEQIECPICRCIIEPSEYIDRVFAGKPDARYCANLVTHYRHEHIRYYDRSWQNWNYAIKNPEYSNGHDEFKEIVNNRAKRQLIRAMAKLKWHTRINGFAELQDNDKQTTGLIIKFGGRKIDKMV